MLLLADSNLIQTIFSEIKTDTSTTSTTYVSLMTTSITTTDLSKLIIQISTSCSTSVAGDWCEFELLIDGVVKRGFYVYSNVINGASSGGIVYRFGPLIAGAHTVQIQWHVGTTGTAQIRPVTTAVEHFSVLIEEVIV